jgi:hypothetical protein
MRCRPGEIIQGSDVSFLMLYAGGFYYPLFFCPDINILIISGIHFLFSFQILTRFLYFCTPFEVYTKNKELSGGVIAQLVRALDS